MSETERDRIPRQRSRPVAFVALSGVYWGDGADRRSWLAKESPAGWQLVYFDVEDEEPVLAGTFATAEEAKRQAGVATRRSPTAHGAGTAQ